MRGSRDFDMVRFLTPLLCSVLTFIHPQSDAPSCPSLHAAFLSSSVLFVSALLCIVFCDPGISITQTKDDLKSVRGISSLFTMFMCDS